MRRVFVVAAAVGMIGGCGDDGPGASQEPTSSTASGSDVPPASPEAPGTSAGEAALPLDGTAWLFASIDQDGTVLDAPEGAELAFSGDAVSVATGCNTGRAEATFGDGTVALGPMVLTRMACVGPAAEWEPALLEALEGELSYEVSGDSLTLTGDTATITLTPLVTG